MIKCGDLIPDANLKIKDDKEIKTINTREYFKKQLIVIFGVPGAFTPTCSAKHLPGFLELSKDIISLGANKIICVSVNDPFVMRAWGVQNEADGKVEMFSDVDAGFAKAMGLSEDFGPNLLVRSRRFSIIIDNNKIIFFKIDDRGSFGNTSAEKILSYLKRIKSTH